MLMMVMPLSVFKHINYNSECTFLLHARAHTQNQIYIYISQEAQNKLQCKDLTFEAGLG